MKEPESYPPEGYSYGIVADRDFRGIGMFGICDRLNWDRAVGTDAGHKVECRDQSDCMQIGIFDDGFHLEATIGKTNPVVRNPVANSAAGETGGSGKWYPATTPADRRPASDDCARRMWIGESLKDPKGILHWEK